MPQRVRRVFLGAVFQIAIEIGIEIGIEIVDLIANDGLTSWNLAAVSIQTAEHRGDAVQDLGDVTDRETVDLEPPVAQCDVRVDTDSDFDNDFDWANINGPNDADRLLVMTRTP